MERPIQTISFTGAASLAVLAYLASFSSPENLRNAWLFTIFLQIFLTSLLSLSIYFLKKRLIGAEKRPRIRRILGFAFAASLLPTFYLSLKILSVLSPLNLVLLIVLIATLLFSILKNNQ